MKHIALIDDDMFIRDLVAMKLSGDKYTIAAAGTAKEGLALLAEQTPDLILLDMELPDRHGLDVLEQLKSDARYSSVPVIVFSNNDDPETQQKAKAAGAKDFFVKVSIDMSELEQQVDDFFST